MAKTAREIITKYCPVCNKETGFHFIYQKSPKNGGGDVYFCIRCGITSKIIRTANALENITEKTA